nr:adenylate/guanylate cyclase domain-containing protein [Phaeobacter sp. HF9A]
MVLFTFAFFHFLNIAAGLVSPELLDAMQEAREAVSRSLPGQIVLYGAFLTHGALAIWQVAMRRTLRMSFTQWFQLLLGVLMPLQLIQHVVYANYAVRVMDFDADMSSVILMLWSSPEALQQYLLLLVVWTHGCIGIHMWLRLTRWWSHVVPYMIGIAVLVPSLALAGLVTEGRRMWDFFTDDGMAAEIMADYNWPNAAQAAELAHVATIGLWVFFGLLGFAFATYLLRRGIQRSRSVRISYVDGPDITADRGLTLLEMSQLKAVPHPSLCGGKGRCTTCRVAVLEGAEHLPAPSTAEARSLTAVQAADNVRLACQIRPTEALRVKRVYSPKGRRQVHAAQGEEKTIAVLFLDIRGFTARSAGLLPYDVVFLLNRFFDAIVPEITRAGGSVDKYMGDGILALFETRDTQSSARAGLEAAANIGVALARFNRMLASEGEDPVRIGMGLHAGTVVLGEIGAAGNAPRTLIGSTVNATSRLEAKTKDLGVELLVSKDIFAAAGLADPDLGFQTFELRGVDGPILALPLPRASGLESLIDSDAPTTR